MLILIILLIKKKPNNILFLLLKHNKYYMCRNCVFFSWPYRSCACLIAQKKKVFFQNAGSPLELSANQAERWGRKSITGLQHSCHLWGKAIRKLQHTSKPICHWRMQHWSGFRSLILRQGRRQRPLPRSTIWPRICQTSFLLNSLDCWGHKLAITALIPDWTPFCMSMRENRIAGSIVTGGLLYAPSKKRTNSFDFHFSRSLLKLFWLSSVGLLLREPSTSWTT